jgi:hypothetical protein
MVEEHFGTGSKKGRGRAKASLDLIEAMYEAAEAAQPITGRGIGYKLFAAYLIPSMARSEMAKVYRLLKEAREEGTIFWEWIVDETRELESVASWNDPAQFMDAASLSYRRDFWQDQPRLRSVERKGHRARRPGSGAQQVRCRIPRVARFQQRYRRQRCRPKMMIAR